MAEDDVEILKKARENFVRKRRGMAEQMVPSGAMAAHFAPSFTDLQAAIEAIDRAIADEEKLPPGYAAEEPKAEPDLEGENGRVANSGIVVDFDPA
jgi:hypothetical protein